MTKVDHVFQYIHESPYSDSSLEITPYLVDTTVTAQNTKVMVVFLGLETTNNILPLQSQVITNFEIVVTTLVIVIKDTIFVSVIGSPTLHSIIYTKAIKIFTPRAPLTQTTRAIFYVAPLHKIPCVCVILRSLFY